MQFISNEHAIDIDRVTKWKEGLEGNFLKKVLPTRITVWFVTGFFNRFSAVIELIDFNLSNVYAIHSENYIQNCFCKFLNNSSSIFKINWKSSHLFGDSISFSPHLKLSTVEENGLYSLEKGFTTFQMFPCMKLNNNI